MSERSHPALQVRRAFALFSASVRFAFSLLIGRVRARADALTTGARLRIAFERLGLTYVKLGQYLAMRFDLLPAEICRELGKLFDDVAPMPGGTARDVVEAELGGPIETLFSSFAEQPLAAASVAQVHEACTRSDRRVVVKVQRVGIREVFLADLRNLRSLTRMVDAFHLLGRLSATEMLDEFATWTLRETDFVQEGQTAERVRRNREPYEVEPAVHWPLTTCKVLTLDYVEGVTLAQLVRVSEQGGPERIAERYPTLDVDLVLHHLTFASLSQIFIDGLFHGDPHPGNIIVLEDNRVAFIDFGIFGELNAYDREILGTQIQELAIGNIEQSLRAYAKQLEITAETDARGFRAEARSVLQEWYDLSIRADSPIGARHLGRYIGRMIDISRRYRLLYDMGFLLYWRALGALHSTALRLSPSFDLMAELREFFAEISPGLGDRVRDVALDPRRRAMFRALGRELPVLAATSLRRAADETIDVTVVAGESGEARNEGNREARWSSAGVVALSLLILATAAVLPGPARLAALLGGVGLGAVSMRRLAPR